ncbi:prefoldin subunit 5 [Biomphalaria glabrata]|uniref:Prefoldin subunit 5-like n=1 Tax=Biomphalaria glabrata TaxID=6526 RepID=A0A2C9KZA1_BIOGL|nr:prefoldin subunit 5-like [Biomphalaria glabrata]KAI8743466.1 prefoldin subunit 5-like [Biomphalaria glabrata]KAI8778275.1 prefoldin subunit 5 [Biomphalaria glabrata]
MAAHEPGAKQIDVTTLPIPHLNHLSQQLEQEVEFLSNSISQLKVAQGKFADSDEAVSSLSAAGSDILVPLTASMYVPGRMGNENDLLIDIGTGYFVSMSKAKAQDFFKRKIDYLTKNIEKVQPVLQDKFRSKQVISEILQAKIQAQLAAAGSMAAKG